MLDHEKLDVYQCAIEHLAFVFWSIPNSPRIVDQWRRASMSVLLNIAEAVGKTGEADRNNRYAIAFFGEAMECGASLDVVRLIDVLPEPELVAAKQLVVRMVGMLSKVCR